MATTFAAYAGAEIAVGVRSEHLGDPAAGPPDRPRLSGRVRFVELLGAERLVHLELDAKPVLADDAHEDGRDIDAAAVTGIRHRSESGQPLVTARFDAHARVESGDRIQISVTPESFHFFDLTTGRAIH